MSLKSLRRVAPTWMDVSKAIFDDKEAHEVKWSSIVHWMQRMHTCCMLGPSNLGLKSQQMYPTQR